jgi:hypothetical protein
MTTGEDINQYILPTIVEMSQDSLANIRLNVAKSLESISLDALKQYPHIYNNSVKPTLEKLVFDSDKTSNILLSKRLKGITAVVIGSLIFKCK